MGRFSRSRLVDTVLLVIDSDSVSLESWNACKKQPFELMRHTPVVHLYTEMWCCR